MYELVAEISGHHGEDLEYADELDRRLQDGRLLVVLDQNGQPHLAKEEGGADHTG